MVATMQRTPNPRTGWTNRFVEEMEETVVMVVHPSADASQLFRFMCNLEELLDDKDNHCKYGSIIYTVGSWEQGTVIMISEQPRAHVKLLEMVMNMAEVQKVEEEPQGNGVPPSLHNKLSILSKLSISSSKTMHITLQEVTKNRDFKPCFETYLADNCRGMLLHPALVH